MRRVRVDENGVVVALWEGSVRSWAQTVASGDWLADALEPPDDADPFAMRWTGEAWQAFTPSPPPPAPPEYLDRLPFWDFLLVRFGIGKEDVITEIDVALAGGALTPLEAERMRLRVMDAQRYQRVDPDLLAMAQLLGVAQTQAEIDALFLEAAA